MARQTPTPGPRGVQLANFDDEEWRHVWRVASVGERTRFLRTLAGLLRSVDHGNGALLDELEFSARSLEKGGA